MSSDPDPLVEPDKPASGTADPAKPDKPASGTADPVKPDNEIPEPHAAQTLVSKPTRPILPDPQHTESPAPAQDAAQAAPPAPEPAPLPRIALVVDDEPANRDFLVRLLEQAKLEVKGASSGAEALKAVEGLARMMLIVIDNKLPDMDGVDLLAQLRTRFPEARMVMATMLDEREVMARAFEVGCDVFLVKPHGFMELFRRLQAPDGSDESELKGLIIDQYGPRPFRG